MILHDELTTAFNHFFYCSHVKKMRFMMMILVRVIFQQKELERYGNNHVLFVLVVL